MKAPRINFASGSRAPVSPVLWIGLIFAAGVFLLDAWLSARSRADRDNQALAAYAVAASAVGEAPDQSRTKPQSRPPEGDAADKPQLSVAHVLRAIESIRIPGARVNMLSVDVEQGMARVEIELGSLDQIAQCLELLNEAAVGLPWQATAVQVSNGQRPDVLTLETRAR